MTDTFHSEKLNLTMGRISLHCSIRGFRDHPNQCIVTIEDDNGHLIFQSPTWNSYEQCEILLETLQMALMQFMSTEPLSSPATSH